MDAAVLAALITAVASLVVAGGNAAVSAMNRRRTEALAHELTHLQATLDREARQEEREISARAELDRAREPLLSAALDLAHRLDNIRREYFLDAYMSHGNGHRAEIATSSTLYRFGRYWCTVEALYDRVVLLQFLADEATRPVAGTRRDVGRTFASDEYDSGRFMMWREEQRAIAELMRSEDTDRGCIGYATFVERYDDTFSRWFGSFKQDLEPSAARSSERFDALQYKLAVLASQLDLQQTYKDQWERLMRGATREP